MASGQGWRGCWTTAPSRIGSVGAMTETSGPTHDDAQDDERVAERAHLLPEEIAAGSDDPAAQAEQILNESDDRTDNPERTQQESPQAYESDAGNRR